MHEFNQFVLTTAAVLGAAATIVASVRLLARVKVFAFFGRALVGDPFKKWVHRLVGEELGEVRDRLERLEGKVGEVREAVEENGNGH